tara:strand:+ start:2424 stop:3182 length:759 start_codon:yes stop_codon:yes gene_type:complete
MNEIDTDWNIKFRNDIVRLIKSKNLTKTSDFKLEKLHNVVDEEHKHYDFNSGVNKFSEFLYETDEEFLRLYHQFIVYLYEEVFDYDFYFQSNPTIRVHFPNSKNAHHYPRYHTDCQYGHPPQETNMWFSLTKNNDTGFSVLNLKNSKELLDIYENDWDKLTYDAINKKSFNSLLDDLSNKVESSLSKIYYFNSLCLHTNQPRKKDTRVSIDIRINSVDDFVDGYIGKGRMKAEFKPDGRFGYYKYSAKKLKI